MNWKMSPQYALERFNWRYSSKLSSDSTVYLTLSAWIFFPKWCALCIFTPISVQFMGSTMQIYWLSICSASLRLTRLSKELDIQTGHVRPKSDVGPRHAAGRLRWAKKKDALSRFSRVWALNTNGDYYRNRVRLMSPVWPLQHRLHVCTLSWPQPQDTGRGNGE